MERVHQSFSVKIMDLKRVLSFPPYPGDYLHPVVYACTAVMLLCLFISIMTYIIHHSMIRISRTGWHALLNFFFHTGLTFGVFAGGINQINMPFLCQIFGSMLHYASLSSMLSLTFMARNICKDVCSDPLKPLDRSRLTQSKSTILRFYLISDGIPLIIVGITAAFGLENYGSKDDALYCWLAWGPSLGGFYAPVCFLVLVMSVYLLCTYIQLKRHPNRKYEIRFLSKKQQHLSSGKSNPNCKPAGTPGLAQDSTPAMDPTAFASGVSVLANEHSFKSQLRATAFTLFLFLVTWAFGAMAVSMGHFLDMIFSCLYGAFCVTLGLFLLIQHCAKRDDVWHHWWACCSSKSKSNIMKDANEDRQSHIQELQQPQCHLSSSYSGNHPLPSAHLVQGSHHKMSPSSHSPTTNQAVPCCMAMMGVINETPLSPFTESVSSLHPQSLSDELHCPSLSLQTCFNRSKLGSFTHPRPCFQSYCSHLPSPTMDENAQNSQLDSPEPYPEASPLASSYPQPEDKPPCLSSHLDKEHAPCSGFQTFCHSMLDSMTSCPGSTPSMHDNMTSCHTLFYPSHDARECQWYMYASADPSGATNCYEKANVFTLQNQQGDELLNWMPKNTDVEKDTLCIQRQGFPRNTLPRQHARISGRNTLGRNRSLQEDGLLGSDAPANIQTSLWKNETTV